MQSVAREPTPPLGALRADGLVDPAHAATLTGELAVALYEHMVLTRALDERMIELQREGLVSSHASAIGEEAAIIGAAAAMGDDDWLFLSSREPGAALWRGMPLGAYAHHAFGTSLDAAHGRSAPDSPFWKAANVVSSSPLVGTQIAHAVGVAWAAKIRKADVAALVFFGEGATSSGDFHTALNFAGVTRAPLVAFCRNNGWATSTPASKQTASGSFSIKAIAYGLRGVRVDGSDVVAVLSAVREARARACAGLGGTLVEAVLVGNDRADPLARTRQHLQSRGLWDPSRDERLATEVRADIERAIAAAQAAPPPARDTMFDDVFAERPWHLEEQKAAR